MVDIWFSSDPHFDHDKMWNKFQRHDGTPLRDFKSSLEMNECIVERHNALIKPQDHWYCLGDVAMKKSGLSWVAKVNGHKRLLRGNHDIFKTKDYLEYFEEVSAYRVFSEHMLCFSHIPIHPVCMERFVLNVHGHMQHKPAQIPGPYRNVSMEMIDYRPVHLDEVLSWVTQ